MVTKIELDGEEVPWNLLFSLWFKAAEAHFAETEYWLKTASKAVPTPKEKQ